jgi:hypothetical protein
LSFNLASCSGNNTDSAVPVSLGYRQRGLSVRTSAVSGGKPTIKDRRLVLEPSAGEVGQWKPVIYRGDGAWIGRMTSGMIGVGTVDEERSSIVEASLRPMWPFMERDLAECLSEFQPRWTELHSIEHPTLHGLLSETIKTGWQSGSPYWMQRAARWLVQAATLPGFDLDELDSVRTQMRSSKFSHEEPRECRRPS